MKNKIIITCLIITIFLLICGTIVLCKKNTFTLIMELNTKLDYEYATSLSTFDIVRLTNVNIIDEQINTLSLGKKEINIKYLDNNNKEKSYKTIINIVDNTKPIIMARSYRTIEVGNDIDLIKGIICADNEDSNIECIIEGEYDSNKIGNYKLKYIAKDRSNNIKDLDFTLSVIEKQEVVPEPYKETYIDLDDVIKEYKNDNTLIGIDISRWQGDNINFEAVKNNGVSFVYIRMGLQDGYNGGYEYDRYYKQNIEGAKKAGLKVGVYFYSYANSNEEAIKQANWIVDNIGEYDLDLPIALDWEDFSNYNTLNMNLYEFNDMALTFKRTIEQRGFKSILYGSKNYLENIWDSSLHDVWLAHYTNKTTYSGDYTLWQLTSSGKVDGIKGNVDIDIMYLKRD